MLGIAFVMMTVAALITFGRWYLLVWAQEFPFRLRDAVRLGFLGLLFNYVAPGSVGGDIFKAILLAKDQASRRTVAVATVILDRILGLLALFMVGAAASLLKSDIPKGLELATALLWVGSAGGIIGLLCMLSPMVTGWKWVAATTRLPVVGRHVGELLHGVSLYQTKRGVVLASVVLSLIGHAGLITGFYFCALAVQQPWIPDLKTHFYFMPNAELFGVLIPVPGGVGALEGAIQWFYEKLAPAGVPVLAATTAGFLAAIAFRVVTVSIAAIGGAYYFTAKREITAAMEEDAASPDGPGNPVPAS
jgi:glycosyltransferase 2 family protein